uniref:Uncharacterized protein n=1 Tax=Arundo donax TaxID=35708 RepID=A0A0A8ZXD7_ARUDO
MAQIEITMASLPTHALLLQVQ